MIKREMQLKLSHQQKLINDLHNKNKEQKALREKAEADLRLCIEEANKVLKKNTELLQTNKNLMRIIKRLSESIVFTYNEIN